MIEFQIDKVKNLIEMSEDAPRIAFEEETRLERVNANLFQELCNIVLELLVLEKTRENG